MSAELDMSQYLDLFLQEAEEQLEILEQETLKLERDPSPDRLQIIFRAAHTLKGSSRAMGFPNMAELTHEMENVLDKLRNNELSVTTDIANALLACLDTLSQMAETIRAGEGDSVENPSLVAELQGFSANGEPVAKPPAAAVPAGPQLDPSVITALQAAQTQSEVYHLHATLHPECVMKFVRVFMLTNLIEQDGELLHTIPDREQLEEEAFDHDFDLFFQSSSPLDVLQTKIGEVSEIASFHLGSWNTEPASTTAYNGPDIIPVEADGIPKLEVQPQPTSGLASAVPATSAPKADPAKKTETGQTVRVDVARLDNLMNLVGELVIDRTRIAQIGADLSARYEDNSIDALAETVGHIARITSDLQDQIMKARMMPIETVFNRFPRVIRDLAQKLGKDVDLVLQGGETELDRSVIEVIGDPLLHILRNSIDHGLEMPDGRIAAGKNRQGRIVVSAKHQENHIVIEITDDGRGIDANRIRNKAVENGLLSREAADKLTDKEALSYIFSSGLSTASEVSEVSGRGVGMDIVRSNIQKLGGIIELETELGAGTKFSLRLPLTLAIIRGLLVKVSGVVYVVPLGSVIETLLVKKRAIQRVKKQEVIVIRGMTTPLVRLREKFEGRQFARTEEGEDLYVVIVGLADQRIGFVVDRLIGEQEVVIKSLSRYCGDVSGVSGATILGDGNVALILDVNSLVAK
jgi:two-component system chemotaxis sensor kinase CheA